jgi:hypothetical protein
MARAGVLDQMTMSSSAQIGAVDRLPPGESSDFVYTLYGCSKGLQDYHLLSRERSNQAGFPSADSSHKSLLRSEISSGGPFQRKLLGGADNFAEIITVSCLAVHYLAAAFWALMVRAVDFHSESVRPRKGSSPVGRTAPCRENPNCACDGVCGAET